MPRDGYSGGYRSGGGGGGYRPYGGGSGGGGSRSTGVYTSSGAPVRNVAAYAATGAQTYTSQGAPISNPSAYSSAVHNGSASSTPQYLYHYTDTASLGRIESSGTIKASTGPGDCALGQGVYFTSKVPQCSDKTLLTNNYDGSGSTKANKVEGYVKVDASAVNAISGKGTLGRDVYVVPGDVRLKSTGSSTGLRK